MQVQSEEVPICTNVWLSRCYLHHCRRLVSFKFAERFILIISDSQVNVLIGLPAYEDFLQFRRSGVVEGTADLTRGARLL